MDITSIKIAEIAAPSFVRTQNGHDKQSLQELAASIQSQGLLQNLVVRPALEEEAPAVYVMVAGRRRLAALKLLGWTEAPCLIKSNTDGAASYLDEVTENLQREDMTLADTAGAVRYLMMAFDDQKKVAQQLSKSPAWVSKHLAVTSGKCPVEVKALMDDQLVSDLETLIMLKQIAELSPAKHPGAPAAYQRLLRIARDGNMTRILARDTLAKLKEPAANTTTTTTGVQRLTTSQTVTETKEDQEQEPRKTFTVELRIEVIAKLERLGGMEWIEHQINAAPEPDAPAPTVAG